VSDVASELTVTVDLCCCVSVSQVQFINCGSVSVVVQCRHTFHWSTLHVSVDVMHHWMLLLTFQLLHLHQRRSATQRPVIHFICLLQLRTNWYSLSSFLLVIDADVSGTVWRSLPYLTFGAGAQGTPAPRPQFRPNVQPRQSKPQENCPVDTIKSVQWKCVITEDGSSEQHCGTALSIEMNWSFLLFLAEGHCGDHWSCFTNSFAAVVAAYWQWCGNYGAALVRHPWTHLVPYCGHSSSLSE